MADAFSIVTLAVGLIGLGVILWAVRTGDADRGAEDDARDFFERHGHWPDETAEEAAAQRARMRGAQPPSVSQPDEQGRV